MRALAGDRPSTRSEPLPPGVALLHGVRHADERGYLRKVVVSDVLPRRTASTRRRRGGRHHQRGGRHRARDALPGGAARGDQDAVGARRVAARRAGRPARRTSRRTAAGVAVRPAADDDLGAARAAGVAHGYQTLEDDTAPDLPDPRRLLPRHARTLAWDDPTVGDRLAAAGDARSPDKDREGHPWPPVPALITGRARAGRVVGAAALGRARPRRPCRRPAPTSTCWRRARRRPLVEHESDRCRRAPRLVGERAARLPRPPTTTSAGVAATLELVDGLPEHRRPALADRHRGRRRRPSPRRLHRGRRPAAQPRLADAVGAGTMRLAAAVLRLRRRARAGPPWSTQALAAARARASRCTCADPDSRARLRARRRRRPRGGHGGAHGLPGRGPDRLRAACARSPSWSTASAPPGSPTPSRAHRHRRTPIRADDTSWLTERGWAPTRPRSSSHDD